MNDKIQSLYSNILQTYQNRFDDLLSICESPIEKILVLSLYDFFDTGYHLDSGTPVFNCLEFIIDEIHEASVLYVEPDGTETDRIRLFNRVKYYNYRLENYWYKKYIGFKGMMNYSEGISTKNIVEGKNLDFIYRQLEVFPQYEIAIDNNVFRVDIALLLKRTRIDRFGDDFSQKIVETRKIVIECDGHEFHSSVEQKMNDNIRSRLLMSDGWKVLRYSGRELYQMARSTNGFYKIFDEIIKIFDS